MHLKGTFCVTQPVFRWMRENGGGVIVNTSSTSGLIGNFGQTNYGAAKGGIWGLSNVLAIEGRKYNIRVWTLAPGALTRMTADLPRYIENPGMALGPDGIAPAVLYMVSELSGDQTGKVLGVSGPRGVREMRMMEKPGWKPPHAGWKAEDIVEHAKEIFFSEEEIKMARAEILNASFRDAQHPGIRIPGLVRTRPGMTEDETEARMTKLTHKAAGTFAIAPTPFHDDGRIDEKSIDRLTDFYAEVGCDGVTVLGILGEAPKLEASEAEQVAKRFVKRAEQHADHRRRFRARICRDALAGARLDGCGRSRRDDRAAAELCAPTTRSSAISSRRWRRSATISLGCCRIIR